MVWGRYRNGIDLIGHLCKHFPKVAETFGVWMPFAGGSKIAGINVA
jgi:hypothetical protein